MSSQSDQADLHRYLSGEKDLEFNNGHEVATTPPVTLDHACLDHVGAHLKCIKESCPNYPPCVDFGEDEAARQPDVPYAHYNRQLRHSPERSLFDNSLPTPTLTLSQKAAYMMPPEYEELKRRRSAKYKGSHRSTRSGRAHEGTPTLTREPSPSTTTGYNDHADETFLCHEDVPEVFPKNDTPSHHSFASDGDEIRRNDIGPFPPQPWSGDDLYNTHYNTNDEWRAAEIWNGRAAINDTRNFT